MNRKTFVMSWFFLIIAGFMLAACTSQSVTSSEKMKWHDYEQGMELAGKEEKKVFISFYADWCAYCKKMDEETFTDKEVVDYVEEHFIPIRVNSDKEADIARKYFIRGLPMTWFLDSEGERISSIPGFIPSEMFMQVLRFVDSDSYKTMSFKEFADRQ